MDAFTIELPGFSTTQQFFDEYADVISLHINASWFKCQHFNLEFHQCVEISLYTWVIIWKAKDVTNDDIVPCFTTALVNRAEHKHFYTFTSLYTLCPAGAGAKQIHIMETESMHGLTARMVIPAFDSRLMRHNNGISHFVVLTKMTIVYQYDVSDVVELQLTIPLKKVVLENKYGAVNWWPMNLESLSHST